MVDFQQFCSSIATKYSSIVLFCSMQLLWGLRLRRKLAFSSITQRNCMSTNSIEVTPDPRKPEREALRLFVESRNWGKVSEYWANLVSDSAVQLPSFVIGDGRFKTTTLQEVNVAGQRGEFASKDQRYLRKFNYAVRLGYAGTKYRGYQFQTSTTQTVEQEIRGVVGASVCAARTDRGVSSIAQVVHFMSGKLLNEQEIVDQITAQSEGIRNKTLKIFECKRVPIKFNSRSSALWRRYQYLFPVKYEAQKQRLDVDVDYLRTILQRLEDKKLSYFSYSYGQDAGPEDMCHMLGTRVALVRLSTGTEISINEIAAMEETEREQDVALCVELVASRFIRQMVRILLATAIREAVQVNLLDGSEKIEKNSDVLVDICNAADRKLTAWPLPAEPLCLVGVGYDCRDITLYKFMPKVQIQALKREWAALDAVKAATTAAAAAANADGAKVGQQ